MCRCQLPQSQPTDIHSYTTVHALGTLPHPPRHHRILHRDLREKQGVYLLASAFWPCEMHSQIQTRLRTSCSFSFTYA